MMGGGASSMGMAMERFDKDGDGMVTSQETREGLQALLAEYDAYGDEALLLAEFETSTARSYANPWWTASSSSTTMATAR